MTELRRPSLLARTSIAGNFARNSSPARQMDLRCEGWKDLQAGKQSVCFLLSFSSENGKRTKSRGTLPWQHEVIYSLAVSPSTPAPRALLAGLLCTQPAELPLRPVAAVRVRGSCIPRENCV